MLYIFLAVLYIIPITVIVGLPYFIFDNAPWWLGVVNFCLVVFYIQSYSKALAREQERASHFDNQSRKLEAYARELEERLC